MSEGRRRPKFWMTRNSSIIPGPVSIPLRIPGGERWQRNTIHVRVHHPPSALQRRLLLLLLGSNIQHESLSRPHLIRKTYISRGYIELVLPSEALVVERTESALRDACCDHVTRSSSGVHHCTISPQQFQSSCTADFRRFVGWLGRQ